MVISTASSAWTTPPVPTMGTLGYRRASSATTACATGRMAAPDIQAWLPAPPTVGWPVSTSICSVGPMESIAVKPLAPALRASSAAAYSSSPQLNVSLARMGSFVRARTARIRSTIVLRVYATHSMASTTPVAATGPAITPSGGVWPMLAISMPGWPASRGSSTSTHCSQVRSAHFSELNNVARRLEVRGTTM